MNCGKLELDYTDISLAENPRSSKRTWLGSTHAGWDIEAEHGPMGAWNVSFP